MTIDAKRWREDSGLGFIARQEKDEIEEVLGFSRRELRTITLVQFDEYLVTLSNYYTYLLSELGILTARVQHMEEELSIKIAPVAARQSASHAGERRAMAISKDAELKTRNSNILNEKSKLEMLRPVCDSIKNKIYVMSKIYDRRLRDEYRSTRS